MARTVSLSVHVTKQNAFLTDTYFDFLFAFVAIESNWLLCVKDSETVYQKYHQYVAYMLAFNAVMLYLPIFAWRASESGLIRALCQNLGMFRNQHCKNCSKICFIFYFQTTQMKCLIVKIGACDAPNCSII